MRMRMMILGAGLLLSAGAARTGEPQPGVAWGAPRDGFQVGIYLTLPRESYKVGDRVGFQLRLKNVSDKPVTLTLQELERWSAHLAADGILRLHPLQRHGKSLTLQPGEAKDAPGDGGTFLIQHWDGAGKSEEPLVRLAPGAYRVACDTALWVPDQNDPNRATGLRAKPGELQIKVSPEGQSPAPKIDAATAEKGEQARWGKPVNGLQLGLRFKGGVNRFRAGDTATAELLVRNLSGRPMSFSMLKSAQGWMGNTPAIRSEKGDYQQVRVVFLSGARPMSVIELNAGGVAVLGYPHLEVLGAADTSQPTITPSWAAKPGKYTWTQYETARPNGATMFDLLLEAGPLEFEITE